MSGEPDISVPARALGDPARARMVAALLGDRAMPAGALAREAGVSPSTASEHLRILLDARIVDVERHGRNRLYQLASDDVSRAVEALQGSHRSRKSAHSEPTGHPGNSVRDAPATTTSQVTSASNDRSARRPRHHRTPRIGEAAQPLEPFPHGPLVAALNIHPPAGRRPWVRGCLDWTGRRAHAAGQLGTQVLRSMESKGWLVRPSSGRTVELTDVGAEALQLLEADQTSR